jgi:hypothetical protein
MRSSCIPSLPILFKKHGERGRTPEGKYTLLHAYSKYFFVSNANIMPQEGISSVVAKLSSQILHSRYKSHGQTLAKRALNGRLTLHVARQRHSFYDSRHGVGTNLIGHIEK